MSDLVLRPYTEIKIWGVNGGNYRTVPLLRLVHNLDLLNCHGACSTVMHDGSVTSLRAVINKYTGDAVSVTAKFNALTETQKIAIENFVQTL